MALVHELRERGVTIILTTHYIEEAEEMADRIGVINKGSLIVVQEKTALMRQLGRKELTLHLRTPLSAIPEALKQSPLSLDATAASCTVRSAPPMSVRALRHCSNVLASWASISPT